MVQLVYLLNTILELYMLIMLLYCLFSFLLSLGVITLNYEIIKIVFRILYQLCEPILEPIRRIMPNFGLIDISPVVVFLVIRYVLQPLLIKLLLISY